MVCRAQGVDTQCFFFSNEGWDVYYGARQFVKAQPFKRQMLQIPAWVGPGPCQLLEYGFPRVQH